MASRLTGPQSTEHSRRHVDAVPLGRALERDGQELVQDGLDINVPDSGAHGHRHQSTAQPVMPRKRLGHRNGEASPHPAPPPKNQQLIQKWPGSSPSDARSPIIPPSTPALRPRLLAPSPLFSDSISYICLSGPTAARASLEALVHRRVATAYTHWLIAANGKRQLRRAALGYCCCCY